MCDDRQARKEFLWAEYPWTRFIDGTPQFEALVDKVQTQVQEPEAAQVNQEVRGPIEGA